MAKWRNNISHLWIKYMIFKWGKLYLKYKVNRNGKISICDYLPPKNSVELAEFTNEKNINKIKSMFPKSVFVYHICG